eukprot:TRINITY_DN7593_c0_g1_i1.p1 TRINITY_DN7593_c0_g1~~TRINITY_DN7593_c0_g1_i1.p1  ORF type:complete len:391 (+),score=29.84 TRINITY_DN7593_c0_g1_i1:39-1211(+)
MSQTLHTVGGGTYIVGQCLGRGSFGRVHECMHAETRELRAVKLEPLRANQPQLLHEARVARHVAAGGVPGFSKVYWYGEEGQWSCLVMDHLGPSVEELFSFCGRRFTIPTAFGLALQALARLQHLHSRDFIHRDIKPENMLMGTDKNGDVLYLVDFGLSKCYRDLRTGAHIPFAERKGLVGTARYCSINTHMGLQQSRRDDLESLGYVILYLVRGSLPWQGIQGPKEERHRQIYYRKVTISAEVLCKGAPSELVTYFRTVRALEFEANPDYDFLRQLFLTVLGKALASPGRFPYDWFVRRLQAKNGQAPNKTADGKSSCSMLTAFTPPQTLSVMASTCGSGEHSARSHGKSKRQVRQRRGHGAGAQHSQEHLPEKPLPEVPDVVPCEACA